MEADGGDGTDTVGAASINGEVCIELLLLEEVFRRDGSGDCAGETHDLMREDSGGGAGGRALPSRPSVEDAGGDDGGRCLVERMLDASDDTLRLTARGTRASRSFRYCLLKQVAKTALHGHATSSASLPLFRLPASRAATLAAPKKPAILAAALAQEPEVAPVRVLLLPSSLPEATSYAALLRPQTARARAPSPSC